MTFGHPFVQISIIIIRSIELFFIENNLFNSFEASTKYESYSYRLIASLTDADLNPT